VTALYQQVLGRAPSTAELVGVEDQLAVGGITQAGLESALSTTGSAGGFATITAPSGNATLAAASGPTLFAFSDLAFNDTINGFDVSRDTIALPNSAAASLDVSAPTSRSSSPASPRTNSPPATSSSADPAPAGSRRRRTWCCAMRYLARPAGHREAATTLRIRRHCAIRHALAR
jgi:hypothetical protein